MTTFRPAGEYYSSTPHRAREPLYTNQPGVVTRRGRSGNYNVIEKDFGDHKRIYHVPIEYGSKYDLSQLDEPAPPMAVDDKSNKDSPRLIRRRIYQEYDDDDEDDDDDDDDYGYVEEVPMISSRRVRVTPRRPTKETEIIERVYSPTPSNRKVEYVYEDDRSNVYQYRPQTQDNVEYVLREPAPKTLYVEEPRPIRHKLYVDEPATVLPAPVPPPARYTPPMNSVRHYSPPPPAAIPNQRFNDISPPPSHRRPPVFESITRVDPPQMRLMDVIAQNRARRGTRLPRPRREVDEAKIYDPPTYNRNIIKNGFIVHK